MGTPEARRGRAIGQSLLLAAGFLVLVAISATSVILVDQAREDNAWVVHTLEVENQISTLLLRIRTAESAVRGYLLTGEQRFLTEHEAAVTGILPDIDTLTRLAGDNRIQFENSERLRTPVQDRLDEFAAIVDLVKRNDTDGAMALLRQANSTDAVRQINEIAGAMRTEENRLFSVRTAAAERTQRLASVLTVAGSGLVIALAGILIFLLRRSARARDLAEMLLRDANLNLETTVEERTADLREANDEIQRFAYIVSHDLRSPLVNIMGFTSELEELRSEIFRRISALGRAAATSPDPVVSVDAEPELDDVDLKLSQDFSEALAFIKSSIGKMDRLISAILN